MIVFLLQVGEHAKKLRTEHSRHTYSGTVPGLALVIRVPLPPTVTVHHILEALVFVRRLVELVDDTEVLVVYLVDGLLIMLLSIIVALRVRFCYGQNGWNAVAHTTTLGASVQHGRSVVMHF